MCLAIPAKITRLEPDSLAEVDILGVTRQISIDLTPSVDVGDYVLVHAGFAIEVVDEQFAQETIDLIREFPELAADDLDTESADTPGMAAQAATSAARREPDLTTTPTSAGASLALEFAAQFGDVPTRTDAGETAAATAAAGATATTAADSAKDA